MLHAKEVWDWNMGCDCQHCDNARELFHKSGMSYEEYFDKYRPAVQETKPHIYMYRWGKNLEHIGWICDNLHVENSEYFCGDGDTPMQAYEDWKETKRRLETGEERFV